MSVASRFISRAERYITLNPDSSKEEIRRIMEKNNESERLIEYTMKIMENINDKS